MLNIGDNAPAFELKDTSGKTVKLADFRGKKVVLYFYPRDDTPGCTIEACSFRDDFAKFAAKKMVILGFSLDTAKSHQKFTEKYKLPFPLLAGTKEIAEAYGAYGNRGIFGFGIKRTTVIIDEQGTVARVFERVKALGHSAAILSASE